MSHSYTYSSSEGIVSLRSGPCSTSYNAGPQVAGARAKAYRRWPSDPVLKPLGDVVGAQLALIGPTGGYEALIG